MAIEHHPKQLLKDAIHQSGVSTTVIDTGSSSNSKVEFQIWTCSGKEAEVLAAYLAAHCREHFCSTEYAEPIKPHGTGLKHVVRTKYRVQ